MSEKRFCFGQKTNCLFLAAESPPKKRRKSNSLSEEDMITDTTRTVDSPWPGEAAWLGGGGGAEGGLKGKPQELKPGSGRKASPDAAGSTGVEAVAAGSKTEQSSGESRRSEAVASTSCSAVVVEKAKVELDTRVVQCREMDKNFERILASVAMKEGDRRTSEDVVGDKEEEDKRPMEEQVKKEETVVMAAKEPGNDGGSLQAEEKSNAGEKKDAVLEENAEVVESAQEK